MQQVIIPARFNGPPDSGNGGYSAGVVGAFIDGDACVRLHSPPPLETPLQVSAAGDLVEVRDGDTLVATGRATELDIDMPAPPTVPEAAEASKGFPGFQSHLYSTCFVCGTRRPGGDGLRLFPGPLAGGEGYACPWLPGPDLLDAAGNVLPLFVWSALDCPGGYGAFGSKKIPMLLGELSLSQRRPVPGGEELVAYAWPLGSQGRKYHGGAAIASADGEVLAVSRSTWIALKQR